MDRLFCLAALLVPILAVSACAAAPERRVVRPVAEFDIAPDGDFIVLPVTIGGRAYPFLLNTGLAATMIDTELRTKLELKKLLASDRERRASQPRERYGGLSATLGNLKLDFPEGVESGGYENVRRKLDLECYGEIGMDVLRPYVVLIDFDEGKLSLLGSLPTGWGDGIRITSLGGEGGAPTIGAAIPGMPQEKFIICTARAGNSIELRSELFSKLVDQQKLTTLDTEEEVRRASTISYKAGRLHAIQVGKHRHEQLVVSTGEQNTIALSYLSRYVVAFDFPRNRMHLKKGKRFDELDCVLNVNAVEIEREGHAAVAVTRVWPQAGASPLGLCAGDFVESINGRPVGRMSNWQVRRLLGQNGAPVSAAVRRGSETLKLTSKTTAAARPAATD